jgi:hypothetical protein
MGVRLWGLLLSSIVAFAQAPSFEHIIIVVQENRTPGQLVREQPHVRIWR